MQNLAGLVARLDWKDIAAQLHSEGCAVVPGVLGDAQVRELAALCGADAAHPLRPLADQGLGEGEFQALPPRLPGLLQTLRQAFHERLLPVADHWNERMGMGTAQAQAHEAAGSGAPPHPPSHLSSHLVRLRAGGYQALHQCGEDGRGFPLQLIALLSAPGDDFTGGEFVMTEQRPRMQSRPIVLPLRKGDVAIIATGQRPHRGSSGYYRVNLKHAIGRVRSGERLGLELLLDGAAA